jgi:hypothetical protein
MMPERLHPEHLYLFIFGPGFGESILIRVPPDHWILIDSCRIAHRPAAFHVFERYPGRKTCAVLTHCHRDHYPGFCDVLDEGDWSHIGCSDLRVEHLASIGESADPEERQAGELEHLLATIRRNWEFRPTSRWWTWRSSSRLVGEAQLLSLHPEESAVRKDRRSPPNDLSTAILLEWKATRLLLGADVEHLHWTPICTEFGALGNHAAMKIPHHASLEALHEGILAGTPGRAWIVTPYNRGRRLPRFEDDQGLARLLRCENQVHLTGLPYAHDRQMDAPCRATRTELRLGSRPRPREFQLPGGLTGWALTTSDDLSCYVVAAFDAEGKRVFLSHGPGTVEVTETR